MKRWAIIILTFAVVLGGLEYFQRKRGVSEKLIPYPSSVVFYITGHLQSLERPEDVSAWAHYTSSGFWKSIRYVPGAFLNGNAGADAAQETIAGGGVRVAPPEKSFLSRTVKAFADSTLLSATEVTLKRLVFGYIIGFVLGIPLGLISARFNFVRETLGIVALGMQGLPSVCWVPLALIWFGPTEGAILFVVVMGTVWSLMLATESGVRTVPPLYIRAANTMGSKGLHLWAKVLVPASLPTVVGGMKQGWAFAWRSLMAAEIYVTILSGYGLGWLLHNGRETLDMAQVLGVMLIIVAVGLLVDRVIFSPCEQWIRARWGLDRQ